ncbi:hypothetical protein LTR28_001511 [Elasticomyces elasticus]|nr:hypothetical protein LTR28_001511 [Elasticomyces elasticus]
MVLYNTGKDSWLVPRTKQAHLYCYDLLVIHVARESNGFIANTTLQVQSGGSFDIDYVVYGPSPTGSEKIVLQGQKERQGDYVFTANEVGEYRFCFDNDMSTFADKMVDFEIAVENEPRASLPSKQGSTPEQTSALEESILKLSGQLSTVTRQQKYFRTRENRNFSTVRSTEKRIWNFSLIESVMMVGMALLQVFIVRTFFTGGRKGYV